MVYERLPSLPDDTFCIMGTVERVFGDGMARHRVHSFTKDQFEPGRLCGMRAEWIILFEEPSEEMLNTVIKPFLVAAPIHEIMAAQRDGTPIKSRASLWLAPRVKDYFNLPKP